jgi:hypothetical protein
MTDELELRRKIRERFERATNQASRDDQGERASEATIVFLSPTTKREN